MTNAQRNKRAILGIIATVLIFVGVGVGIRLTGGGQAAAPSGGGGGSAPAAPSANCYITLSGDEIEYVSIEMAQGQSCYNTAFALQQVFTNATVTSDGSSKPFGSGWSPACIGTLTADDDPATVVAQGGDDSGGACNVLGFTSP
jgi:hypothetical protein